MGMSDTAQSYRRHWATLTGRPESEIYVPHNLRKKIIQCEGCEAPLSHYLADGARMDDFDIEWYVCEAHEPVSDHYDAYWYND